MRDRALCGTWRLLSLVHWSPACVHHFLVGKKKNRNKNIEASFWTASLLAQQRCGRVWLRLSTASPFHADYRIKGHKNLPCVNIEDFLGLLFVCRLNLIGCAGRNLIITNLTVHDYKCHGEAETKRLMLTTKLGRKNKPAWRRRIASAAPAALPPPTKTTATTTTVMCNLCLHSKVETTMPTFLYFS